MTWFFYPLGMWGLRYFKCKVEVFDPLGLEFSIGWQMWVYLHFSTCRHSVRPAAGGEYALLYSWNYFGIFVKINCLLCPPPSALWARISRPQLATSLPYLGWSPQTKVRPIVLQEPATSWKTLTSTWCQPPAEQAEPVLQTCFQPLGKGSSLTYLFGDPQKSLRFEQKILCWLHVSPVTLFLSPVSFQVTW